MMLQLQGSTPASPALEGCQGVVHRAAKVSAPWAQIPAAVLLSCLLASPKDTRHAMF